MSRNAMADSDRSSLALENDRTPTHTSESNVTTAPTHTDGADSPNDRMRARNVSVPVLSGRDSVDETEFSVTDTLIVATRRYIYYRIYTEDGAIPSKTPATPSDPFMGRIIARSVPPPHTTKAVKHSIAKVEDIKDRSSTSLFLTPYSQSPMDDDGEVTVLNRTGPGSTPQEPLALVAKMSYSERSALESGRSRVASAAEPDTTPPEIRYLYYLLYVDDYEMQSKVAIDPEVPSLGRIRADSVAPPYSLASIKRCISRVERTPALVHANIFADISCKTPLKEAHISNFCTDGPGLNPNEPMAIVQRPIVQEGPSIPNGKYVIKNGATDIFWSTANNPITTIHFWAYTQEKAKNSKYAQWYITNDNNGNIFMRSLYAPSSWVGAEIKGSTVPVPWRLIPSPEARDNKFKIYHLTTDMNHFSQNPRVPALERYIVHDGSGSMATLEEGDLWQMWEFIHI